MPSVYEAQDRSDWPRDALDRKSIAPKQQFQDLKQPQRGLASRLQLPGRSLRSRKIPLIAISPRGQRSRRRDFGESQDQTGVTCIILINSSGSPRSNSTKQKRCMGLSSTLAPGSGREVLWRSPQPAKLRANLCRTDSALRSAGVSLLRVRGV
jgi:hypothetical protein